ncbi:MAG: hypothetical protein GIX03_06285 [Candidatus Eremiobacteraeota bacterium]|nr:hypothetical protein [Candidatus Eremiobacteraeota bacterium]MBC5802604.1 hypothetical protein [Candidatus Eremiobacteraeota bacterium]MBC5822687.1 hypothetical protein [Candidatus Eremiobacteraeota bacterium]
MIRRRAAAGVIAALLLAVRASPAVAVDQDVLTRVPGVRIPVRLSERLSSQDAKAGQHFGFETTNEVTVAGTDVPSGTRGDGVIVLAQSGLGRNPGKLELAATALHLRDGRTLPVGLAPSEAGTKNAYDAPRPGRFALPTVVGTVVFGGVVRDTNVVYEKGTAFTVIAPPPPTAPPAPPPSPSA